ncbi:hypothetical protein Tco_0085515 [Tanacetum coccineum]
MTAKSRTVNNISYIDATVAGKPVTISEASIRSDLLFDDVDGIDSLTNQAIFDNIQLMGQKTLSFQQLPATYLHNNQLSCFVVLAKLPSINDFDVPLPVPFALDSLTLHLKTW